MNFPSSSVPRLRCVLALLAAFGLCSAARAQSVVTASGYTITKLIDNTTLIPGGGGQTFSLAYTGKIYLGPPPLVTDGTTAAFTVPGSTNTSLGASCWSVSTSGGTPVKLVDTTVTDPAGSGQPFYSVIVVGIGGGMVVFEGVFLTNGGYGRGGGLYAVPVGGGPITILADTNTAIPDGTGNFSFTDPADSLSNDIIGRVSVRGAQVFFAGSGGIYLVPVTGGTITRFGDDSMTIVDLSLNAFYPDGYPQNSGQCVDLGGGTAVFAARAASNPYSCDVFVAPATGLTVGTTGYVDNAELIASPSTPVPGQSSDFNIEDVSVFADDSGTPVIFGGAGGSSGLYAFCRKHPHDAGGSRHGHLWSNQHAERHRMRRTRQRWARLFHRRFVSP